MRESYGFAAERGQMLVESAVHLLALGFEVLDLGLQALERLDDRRAWAMAEPEGCQEDSEGEGQNNSDHKCCGRHCFSLA